MFLARSCLHAVLVALMTTVMADEKGCDLLGEDDQESTREKSLLKRLEPLISANESYEATGMDGPTQQTYTFKVCQDVFRNASHAGLVQFDHKTNVTKVVGRISKTHIIGASTWIMLTYKGGDTYGSRCQKEPRTAIIMIVCNRKALATGFKFVGEEREKLSECSYVFQLESSVACLPEDSHLSVGSILLITFASLVAVYLIGGFLYQRLVVGAKGMEQFPHFAFWQDLGNLVADGCDFVCRSKPQNVPAAYRGVGDDQLGEESEERDDHLLPM